LQIRVGRFDSGSRLHPTPENLAAQARERGSVDLDARGQPGCTRELISAWKLPGLLVRSRAGAIEQKTDPRLKGSRWKLLRDRASLTPDARADLNALSAKVD
jgi:hypothetical protein